MDWSVLHTWCLTTRSKSSARSAAVDCCYSIIRTTIQERRWRRFRWNPIGNPRAWGELEARLADEIPRLDAVEITDARQALEHAARWMDLARDYIKVHVTSLLFANLWYQITGGLIGWWVDSQGDALAQTLLRCPEDNLTVVVNHDLWQLARLAEREGTDLDHLPAEDTPFGQALAAFLRRHGHRADATWEIMSPRWAENPQRVLGLVRHHLGTADQDPAELAQQQARAGREALARLQGQVHVPHRRWLLVSLVQLTRRYLLLRENQRYAFDRILYGVKRAYLWIGARMVEGGVFASAAHIRFLKAAEVERWVAGGVQSHVLRSAAAAREAEWRRCRHVELSDFIRGDDPIPGQHAHEGRLMGLGASPGLVRGRVRVVHALSEAHDLRKGEILVTRATDPAWTPLFLVASGLVLELGGQLSHGAVVAREYGLPTVVNLTGATRILRDGQEITVDGGRGLVWLHPAAAS